MKLVAKYELVVLMMAMAAVVRAQDLGIAIDSLRMDSIAPADTIIEKGDRLAGDFGRLKDGTRVYSDSVIYQGMNIKLDIATTIIEAAVSKGKIMSFEMAWNVRLKQRYYPTLELGYAKADADANGGYHLGQGGFFRVGLDINGLRKHPERLNALLVGVRVGTSMQKYDLMGVTVNSPYWEKSGEIQIDGYRLNFYDQFKADCWGEILAGCQVQVWEGLQFGWYVRFKFLFTKSVAQGDVLPYYIPGFGYRGETNWGFNYYIGYKF